VTTNTGRGAALDAERADCCIVGGGPGGAFLGLLLALLECLVTERQPILAAG